MKKRVLIIVLATVLLQNFLFAQNRTPQGIRRVMVTSKYEVVNGKRTTKSTVIKQEIKDSLDRMHTILNRDYNTQNIISHIWHTFNGKQIVRTDEFFAEKLKYFRLFTYTSDSLLDTETIYKVSPGDTSFNVKIKYKFNLQRKPIQIDAVDINGKLAYKSKFVYDTKGTEIKRTVKFKKEYAPLDSIITLINTPVYDSIGRITAEVITRKYVNGVSKTESFRYGYDKKGLLSRIETLDNKGNLITKKTLEYNDKGKLKFISVYDSQNVLVEYYANRYELYPTRDRRNQIIEY